MLYDCVEVVDVEAVVRFVKELQRPDGSFVGDKWGLYLSLSLSPRVSVSPFSGEVDTRFSFCSLACLALLVRKGLRWGQGAWLQVLQTHSHPISLCVCVCVCVYERCRGGWERWMWRKQWSLCSSA